MAKIVVLGGGTGLSVILRGLKKYTGQLSAIVTVADDGGGSGVLREDLGMLPPGDIRNCLLALSNKEPLLQDLFQYRFDEGRLKGQSFGNLMIAAMMGISQSFEEAIEKISDIFKITGEVLPVASSPGVLSAELENGSIVRGESNIPYAVLTKKSAIKKVWLNEDLVASDAVLERIANANSIVIGPGSLYTSVISVLKVAKLVNAINNSNARVFYITNIMTQPGETDLYSPCDHVLKLLEQTGLNKLDYILVNNGKIGRAELLKYKNEGAVPSILDVKDEEKLNSKLNDLGISSVIVKDDFVVTKKGYIVHNSNKISDYIISKTQTLYN